MNIKSYLFLLAFFALDTAINGGLILAPAIVFYFLFNSFKLLSSGKQISKHTKLWICSLIILAVIATFISLFLGIVIQERHTVRKTHDPRIISAIGQARTVMVYIEANDGNYDNFSCTHEDMIALCQEIDENYGPDDDNEPIIVHDSPNNSQVACIYSPLSTKKGYWYCANSEGFAGDTNIDPSTTCREDDTSTVCPPGEHDEQKDKKTTTTADWKTYRNEECGFEFRITPILEENGYRIEIGTTIEHYFPFKPECILISFKTKPIYPYWGNVPKDRYENMFFIKLCSQDYCQREDGKEVCEEIKRGEGERPFIRYLTENDFLKGTVPVKVGLGDLVR